MSSYQKEQDCLGFRYTEPGPDAVYNYCNLQEDRAHNFFVAGIYFIILFTFFSIGIMILKEVLKW